MKLFLVEDDLGRLHNIYNSLEEARLDLTVLSKIQDRTVWSDGSHATSCIKEVDTSEYPIWSSEVIVEKM